MAKIPKYARYQRVQRKLLLFHLREAIYLYPIEPVEVIRRNRWGLVTYSQLAKAHGASIEDVIKAPFGKDGWAIFDEEINNYVIAYNDKQPIRRIRFTLLHEIGHIYLGHFIDFDETQLFRGGMTESEYNVLENEANAFARNALIPVSIYEGYEEFHNNKITQISAMFRASSDAVKTRRDLLYADKRDSQALVFPDLFIKTPNYIPCVVCGNKYLSNTDEEFCTICGSITKEGVHVMKYEDGYELDEHGHAQLCPRCENEEIFSGGDYCIICGLEIINRCSAPRNYCGCIVPGNARYCPVCGETSTFFNDGLLKPYTEYDGKNPDRKRMPQNAPIDNFVQADDDFIEIDDDELPF